MNRRAFLSGLMATAGGILVPYEPRRVYGFAPDGGWPQGDGFWVINWSERGYSTELIRDLTRRLMLPRDVLFPDVETTIGFYRGPYSEMGNAIARVL